MCSVASLGRQSGGQGPSGEGRGTGNTEDNLWAKMPGSGATGAGRLVVQYLALNEIVHVEGSGRL